MKKIYLVTLILIGLACGKDDLTQTQNTYNPVREMEMLELGEIYQPTNSNHMVIDQFGGDCILRELENTPASIAMGIQWYDSQTTTLNIITFGQMAWSACDTSLTVNTDKIWVYAIDGYVDSIHWVDRGIESWVDTISLNELFPNHCSDIYKNVFVFSNTRDVVSVEFKEFQIIKNLE